MMPENNSDKVNYWEVIEKIDAVFRQYSISDIAYSLLIASLWLPNIASGIKQQFLYWVFLRIDRELFSDTDKIYKYSDYSKLLAEILPLLPSFPMIEDFVPEADWGQVKFHYEKIDYRIFYGCEIENVYDYLMLFQTLYCTRDENFIAISSRSPDQEFQDCLSLQHAIISGITTQPQEEKLEITPGDFRIPPEEFWQQTLEFLKSFNPLDIASRNFINHYMCSPGSLPEDLISYNEFLNAAYDGSLLPYYFLNVNNLPIPILPRSYSSVLIEEWANIFKKYECELDENNSYSKHIGIQIYSFLKTRLRGKDLFPLVCAVTRDEQPHEIVFACSFVSKNRLILVYSPAPFSSGEELGFRFSEKIPLLKQALEIIGSSPVSLGLLGQNQTVRYDTDSNGRPLKPELIIVFSQTSTAPQQIGFSDDLPGRVTFLDQFLGVFDEIERADELSDFIDYFDKFGKRLLGLPYGFLDIYGSFKDSSGVLVNGAREPNMIYLDPHWGSNHRYESLSKFWQQYPKTGFFGHPRSWRVEKISDRNVRLIARGYFGSAIYCELTNSCLFSTAPFEKMHSYQQIAVSNILMEALEDNIRRNKIIIESLSVFSIFRKVQVNFFPWSMVKGNDEFKHLSHLDPDESVWRIDKGWVTGGVPGVRIVFDENKVSGIFEESQTSSFEIDLLIEVLRQLNQFALDPDFDTVTRELEKLRMNRPRFKMASIQKDVAFPEFVSPLIPTLHHYKMAQKRVAEVCRDAGFIPGDYELQDAQVKLNFVRAKLVDLINSEVKKFNFAKSLPYMIEKIDALVFEYEREINQIEYSLEHDVDFRREERYAEKHNEFVRYHRAYRYLIEKFVQLKPYGKSGINPDQLQALVAHADRIQEMYNNSDSIHYGVYQIGVNVDDDFIMEVKHAVDLPAMEQVYSEEEANIRLGVIGSQQDRVTSTRPVETLIDKLDEAFLTDLGFGFRNMVNVLKVLSQWSFVADGIPEHTWYTATKHQITEICTNSIDGIKATEIPQILDFLTLKKNEVIKLVGKTIPEPDIPVWEFRKRFARYNLRPLIKIKNNYIWGPYSVFKSGILWTQTLSSGQMPYDMGSRSIQALVEEEKTLIEKALVDKTEEVLRRFTPFVEKNVYLDKRDEAGNHPGNLGDYDVLAYYPDKNAIIYVEDKDLLPPFCLKDAKRVRDSIFGREGKDDGYLGKVERREKYLLENVSKIAQLLGWQIDQTTSLSVVSFFISRHAYWWTKFPPRETRVRFLRIELFESQF